MGAFRMTIETLQDLDQRCAQVIDRLKRGQTAQALRFIDSLPASVPGRAWRAAIETLLSHAEPSLQGAKTMAAIDTDSVAEGRGTGTTAGLSALGAANARHAFVTWNRADLARWTDFLEGLLERSADAPALAHLSLKLAQYWLALIEGRTISRAHFDETFGQAQAAEAAHLAIEVVATRGLMALAEGHLENATRDSRRATRMARSEGSPQAEYFANVILARVRRFGGHPHLSTRITTALLRVVPPEWEGWIRWEMVLSGHDAPSPKNGEEPPSMRAASALDCVLEAAKEGGDFPTARSVLVEAAGACAFASKESDELLSALDIHRPRSQLDGPIYAWCAGTRDKAPAALVGILRQPEAAEAHQLGSAVAFIVKKGALDARRIPAIALHLATGPEVVATLRSDTRKRARQDAALAVLMLAGVEGMDDETFFQRTFGFAYRKTAHRGNLDVLKHRLRTRVEALGGELVRINDRNIIRIGDVVVPDMRCAPSLGDRVLRLLAKEEASAKQLASRVGVSLRAAQGALRQLLEDGSCAMTQQGRRVTYRVEAPTFKEATDIRPR